jgi:hypothetical protein
MFLYIALVDLVNFYSKSLIFSRLFFQLPTLLTDGEVELKRFLVVNTGFISGIAIMFLLALFEDNIKGI